MITFEKYLIEYWSEHDGMTVLDDDQPDAFDDWHSMLETHEIINFAENYGKLMYLRGMDEGVKLYKDQIKQAETEQDERIRKNEDKFWGRV